jgi:aminoglycoside/choline kinase family phosphotransferase
VLCKFEGEGALARRRGENGAPALRASHPRVPAPSNVNDTSDDRRAPQLREWLTATLGNATFTLAAASADASFRRYFRVALAQPFAGAPGAPTLIAMDAPPPREDCRPFVHVARLLRDAGVNAPSVLAQDLERGFLLLTDLGTTTYLDALDDARFGELFGAATVALVRWQLATEPRALPAYDEALIRRELALFPDWYVERHLETTLTADERRGLESVSTTLVEAFNAQPRVFVHRDYMPRNLMVCEPGPGVLDFQDAVVGPIAYDVVSLFKDAFVSWPEERVLDGVVRYWEKAKRAGLPVDADFSTFFRLAEWTGLQRHLKVLGIFARLRYRDAKAGYVEDTPRFLRYVRPVAERYREFEPLVRILDRLEARVPQTGHTAV